MPTPLTCSIPVEGLTMVGPTGPDFHGCYVPSETAPLEPESSGAKPGISPTSDRLTQPEIESLRKLKHERHEQFQAMLKKQG